MSVNGFPITFCICLSFKGMKKITLDGENTQKRQNKTKKEKRAIAQCILINGCYRYLTALSAWLALFQI